MGKTVNELQSNVVVSEDSINGTLHYVTGYTGFNSAKPEEQKGNYLALKFEVDPEEAETTVDLLGGTKGPVALDEDRNIILLIKNKDSQKVKVTVTKDKETVTKTYGLSGLTLEAG